MTISLWPITADRDESGTITLDGVSLVDIAKEFGTPVYVYDVATLRQNMRQFRDSLAAHYPKSHVVFAGKAFLTSELIRILREEEIGLDVVSGGELYLALRAGMDAKHITFHGNNKSRRELQEALDAGIGKIVIDSEDELDLLIELAQVNPVRVMVRLNPGVDVHTHRKISTGVADSKFGLPISTGQAEAVLARISHTPKLEFLGYHAHVGSQLFDADAYTGAIGEQIAFAAQMRASYGLEMRYLTPGGGFGIPYVTDDAPMPIDAWMRSIGEAVIGQCAQHGLELPTVIIEPGRSIVGPAGVAVYEVGSRKKLPGIRTYVSVDGGMADNIRPSLYEAKYSAELVTDGNDRSVEEVTIAGKFCESGDILIENIELPELVPGDLLALPAAGAYCLAMASNYNYAQRPPVVFVEHGMATLVRRRETYEDLIRLDVTRSTTAAL